MRHDAEYESEREAVGMLVKAGTLTCECRIECPQLYARVKDFSWLHEAAALLLRCAIKCPSMRRIGYISKALVLSRAMHLTSSFVLAASRYALC